MTIIAAEAAGPAVGEAESAVAARGAAARRARPAARPSTGGRAAPRHARAVPEPVAMPEGPSRDHSERRGQADRARSTRNHGKRTRSFTARKGSYHTIVAAEFFLAISIVIVAPLVEPGSSSSKGGTGPSPYGHREVVRIAGVMTLFFILALVSKGRPGKMAVMFGGLVDLGVLFRASQAGALKGVAGIFAGSGSSTAASPGSQGVTTA